jgi:hypothetical protein
MNAANASANEIMTDRTPNPDVLNAGHPASEREDESKPPRWAVFIFVILQAAGALATLAHPNHLLE